MSLRNGYWALVSTLAECFSMADNLSANFYGMWNLKQKTIDE